MTYYIVNPNYKFYPYQHKNGTYWTWMIENAKEYTLEEAQEAQRHCDYLLNYDRPISNCANKNLKIVPKFIIQRKEKLKKLNSL